MTHVMLDLETLSTRHDAMILSIGAVKFDASNVLDRFEVTINPESSERYGRHISASTTMWWMDGERTPAREHLLDAPKVDLPDALYGFAEWFGSESLPVWGNAATFDNAILRSAYAAIGEEEPWKFWDDRCYRTVKNLAPEIKLKRVGTYHKAVDDADSQAVHLMTICAQLGIRL